MKSSQNAIESEPELTIENVQNLLTTYITNMETMPKLKNKQKSSFMLWGAPGLGKSDSVKNIAKQVEKKVGKQVEITDVRLILFNPVDLRGIPVPDAERKTAKWLEPYIFSHMNGDPNVINILMLDEISAAPPSVQAAAYQITLDRQIGEHKLPDNCYIICAGNRTQDGSVSYKMPKALSNRLTHYVIKPNFDSWKKWALENRINKQIIAFLTFKNNCLFNFDSSTSENAFATPRTWEKSSDLIDIYGDVDSAFYPIAGTIGLNNAYELKTYCKVFDKIPNIQDILNGKCHDIPGRDHPDIYFALSTTLSMKLADENITDKYITNIMDYITNPDFDKEFSVLVVKDALNMHLDALRLLQNEAFDRWNKENEALIM